MSDRMPYVLVLFFAISQTAFAGDDGVPAGRLAELKAAAVYIKHESGRSIGSGSGFLIHVDGDSGFIVTNHHVMDFSKMRLPGKNPVKTSVVFHSGTKNELVVSSPQVVFSNAKVDIAVLKVTAKGLPKPLDLGQRAELRETMAIYAIGFPLGDLLAAKAKGNPGLTVHKGSITSLRLDDQGKLDKIQVDGGLLPGSSGCPIVDGEGRFVGVAQAGILATQLNFAIPAPTVMELLEVRVKLLEVYTKKVSVADAEFEVAIAFNDPIGKIKSASVNYLPKENAPNLKENKDGTWPQLARAEKFDCQLNAKAARAKLVLKSDGKKKTQYVLQAVWVQNDGQIAVGEPVVRMARSD